MATSVLVFDPTAPRRAAAGGPGRTLGSLAGRTVGFIDNAKPNFNHLVDDLAQLLVERYGVAEVIKRGKRGASMPAPEAVIEEVAARCDLVVTGSGD